MTRFALISGLIMPVLTPMDANAEGVWEAMTGHEIEQALADKKLQYKSANQVFQASGETQYNQDGRLSAGEWRVDGDKYCSVWPPQGQWACYHMDRSADKVRFVGAGESDITVGSYIE